MSGVLAVNCGSTSIKLEAYAGAFPLAPIGAPPEPAAARTASATDLGAAIDALLQPRIDRVAHRIVRMPDGTRPVEPIDDALVAAIVRVAGDAPLHDRVALDAIRIARERHPAIPQFAVSDSAFHRTLAPAAATYALPIALARRGLRKIGYHGLSHEYAAHRAAALSGRQLAGFRAVSLHLGGGCSLCATHGGVSVDTTMGYTPLDGLPMATRSGAVDPGLLLHLLREGHGVAELEEMLERRSGLLGISGRSGDVRELEALAEAGDADAALALDVFGWRVRAAIGGAIATLGGIDALTFSGGIGEHSARIRAAALAGLDAFDVRIDPARNAQARGDARLSPDGARIAVYAIAAREGWQLARAALAQ